MGKPETLRQLNDEWHKRLVTDRPRPKQISDQRDFNIWFLKKLNDMALRFSKGKRPFEVTDENEEMLMSIFAYLNRNSNDKALEYMGQPLDLHKGLFISGLFGVGKTLLLTAIYENRMELGLRGYFTTAQAVFDTGKPKPEKRLSDITGPNYCDLWLDDVGEEPAIAKNFGTDSTPVGDLIKKKANAWERMPEAPRLFGSSNCMPDKIKDIYGGRVESRIEGVCNWIISIQETDYRKL